jgi:hypothetical protein
VAWEYPTELEAKYAASMLESMSGVHFTVIPRPSDEVQAVRPQILRDDGGGDFAARWPGVAPEAKPVAPVSPLNGPQIRESGVGPRGADKRGGLFKRRGG